MAVAAGGSPLTYRPYTTPWDSTVRQFAGSRSGELLDDLDDAVRLAQACLYCSDKCTVGQVRLRLGARWER
jgi:hypothetical protein